MLVTKGINVVFATILLIHASLPLPLLLLLLLLELGLAYSSDNAEQTTDVHVGSGGNFPSGFLCLLRLIRGLEDFLMRWFCRPIVYLEMGLQQPVL
jgi:hypothetical protein